MASNGYPQQAEVTQSYPPSTASTVPAAAAAPGSASNSAAPQPPDQVGWFFVESYYTNLNKNPDRLPLFYHKRSSLVWGDEGEVSPMSQGRVEISERINSLGFKDCKVRVTNVDSQASANGGIIIQVMGEMSNASGPNRRFTQTFFLAEQPGGYYVLNDILRYLKEEEELMVGEIPEEIVEGELVQLEEEVPAVAEATESVVAIVEEPAPEPEEVIPPAEPEPEPEPVLEPAQVKQEEPITIAPAVPQIPVAVPVAVAVAVAAPEPVNGTPAVESEPEPEPVVIAVEEPVEVSEPVEEPIPAPPKEEPVAPAPAPAEPAPVAVAPPPPVVEKPAPPPLASVPVAPPKPATWASLLSNKTAATTVAAAPAPAVPTVQPAPAAQVAPVAPAQPAAAAAGPTAAVTTPTASAGQGWQSVGDNSRRHPRPQSISAAGDMQTLAYVKNVNEAVDVNLLKDALAKYGPIKSFDHSKPRNCAFVEFENPAGFKAARAASPISIGGQNVLVEERRQGSRMNGPGYGSSRSPVAGQRGDSRPGQGRGFQRVEGRFDGRDGREGGRGGPRQGSGRGGFTPRGRGGATTSS